MDEAVIDSPRRSLEDQGYVLVPAVLEAPIRARLAEAVDAVDAVRHDPAVSRRGGVYAIRNLLSVVPEVGGLLRLPAVRSLVEAVLGPGAVAVRGIFFDKIAGANWKVPWHQDLSIAVAERVEVDGWGPWSRKAGVLHVQPPVGVLERMLALRFHLDAATADNGALRVIAGSHRAGRLDDAAIGRARAARPEEIVATAAGDLVAMRPLLLHASSAGSAPGHRAPGHRRVIHLELAAADALPLPLRWHAAVGGAPAS